MAIFVLNQIISLLIFSFYAFVLWIYVDGSKVGLKLLFLDFN